MSHAPTDDPFRTLCSSIVSQQLSSKAAESIWNRFLGVYGGSLPPPTVLASTDVELLRSAGLSRAKAASVKDLAVHFASGELTPEQLWTLEAEALAAKLTAVRGIGPWSVDMFLMFGLNRPDVLPVGDLGIRKAMAALFGLDALPKPPQMVELAEPWRPWRTVASWYLWKSLDVPTS